MGTGGTTSLRRAGPDDAEALTRLRGVMLDAMAEDPPVAGDAAWHEATAAWFRARLAEGERFAAFVVDEPARGPVACAVGSIGSGAPVPGRLGRPNGAVFSVATEPDRRGRGHARACVGAVLGWLDDHGVARTDLSATPEGLGLYRSLGFADRPWVTMRRPGRPT